MSQATVYVGMSGGVDSSLSAALLKEQGYRVVGVYMKNWTRDLPGFVCPWKEDYQDAKRVAVKLDIEFKLFDFEDQYRQRVVDYLVKTYQAGLTPNPDIVCNQEIKFKLFLETALSEGADYIATGHYVRSDGDQLLKGQDSNKDQSYFLYRIESSAVAKSIFPIGELTKPEVRARAASLGLATADKPDSQGICFVGEVGIKQFLLAELGPQTPGPIVNQSGTKVGEHEGAIFYTIGQRHGLNVGGGLPYYVTHKDMASNTVFVTTDLNDHHLWSKEVKLHQLHWINQPPKQDTSYSVICRYRSSPVDCRIKIDGDQATLQLENELRAVSPGQSAVIYDNDRVVGGGIISSAR